MKNENFGDPKYAKVDISKFHQRVVNKSMWFIISAARVENNGKREIANHKILALCTSFEETMIVAEGFCQDNHIKVPEDDLHIVKETISYSSLHEFSISFTIDLHHEKEYDNGLKTYGWTLGITCIDGDCIDFAMDLGQCSFGTDFTLS